MFGISSEHFFILLSDALSCACKGEDAYFCVGHCCENCVAATCERCSRSKYVVYKQNVFATKCRCVGDAEDILDIFPTFIAMFVSLCGVGYMADDTVAIYCNSSSL